MKPRFCSTQCHSFSVVTVYGTRSITYRDKCFVLLHSYFLKYVPSAQYDYFL